MKVILGLFVAAIVFFGLLYLGTFLKLFTLPWLKFDTQVTQNAKIIEKTYDANNQIYNYHWFKEREGAIAATRAQIGIHQTALGDFQANAGPRDKWTFEDKTEEARMRSVVNGLKSHLENLITEYNARANEADRAIFKDGLKTFIPLD